MPLPAYLCQNGILIDGPRDPLACTETKEEPEELRMVCEGDTFLDPAGLLLGCTAKSGNRKVLPERQMWSYQPLDSLLRYLLFNPHIEYEMG